MINAVGRDIPEEILKATGKEVFQGNHHFDGHVFKRHGANTPNSPQYKVTPAFFAAVTASITISVKVTM